LVTERLNWSEADFDSAAPLLPLCAQLGRSWHCRGCPEKDLGDKIALARLGGEQT
jgi:hypothetical protein